MVVNYDNGKIYKVCSFQTDKVYYGSTTQPLCKRMTEHRRNLKKYKNGKYWNISVNQVLEYDDSKIILVESWPCNNKYELETRERFYIENNYCVNKYIPCRSKGEWKKQDKFNNPQKYIDYNKMYYAKNRESLLKKCSEKILCDTCNEHISKAHFSDHKKTKKHLSLLGQIPEKKQIVKCDCGASVIKNSLSRHKKTKKHINSKDLKANL